MARPRRGDPQRDVRGILQPSMRLDDRTIDLSAEEGARIIALALLGDAKEAAERLPACGDEEALHDFRVALRRLRTALRAFRPWLEGAVRRRQERRLKRIAASTNAARDAEVQLAWLRSRRDALHPERHRPGLDLLLERFEARRTGGGRPAAGAKRFLRVAVKLDRRLRTFEREVLVDAEPRKPLADALAALIRAQAEELRRRLEAIQGAWDGERIHTVRIVGKRLRYQLEPLRDCRVADATAAVAHLKRLQDLLGELHDAHVLAEELRDVLAESAAARARELHAVLFGDGPTSRAARPVSANPRPGLVAVARLVRERRDVLYDQLEREWRAAGAEALLGEAAALATALEAHAGGALERGRKYLVAGVPPQAEAPPGPTGDAPP